MGWKKLAFSLVTSLCTLSVLFLMFSLYSYIQYLQRIESLYRQTIGENGITYLKTSANETLLYEFRENYFHKGRCITNEDGIRSDRHYIKDKPSTITRIACIGDSITADSRKPTYDFRKVSILAKITLLPHEYRLSNIATF